MRDIKPLTVDEAMRAERYLQSYGVQTDGAHQVNGEDVIRVRQEWFQSVNGQEAICSGWVMVPATKAGMVKFLVGRSKRQTETLEHVMAAE